MKSFPKVNITKGNLKNKLNHLTSSGRTISAQTLGKGRALIKPGSFEILKGKEGQVISESNGLASKSESSQGLKEAQDKGKNCKL